jgi:hypothetical protein
VPLVENYPTESPSASPTISPAPTVFTINMYLTLELDTDWYKEIGWKITDADDPDKIWEEIKPGHYQERAIVTEEIALPFDQTYSLTLEDNFGDGMQRGYYLWTKDPTSGTEIVLVDSTGKFNYTQSHNFTLDETIFDGDAVDGGEGNSTGTMPDIDVELTRKGNDDGY